MTGTHLTGTVVSVPIPANHVVAAGVGSRVDWQRPGWTVGDLRDLLATIPAEFDSNTIIVHAPGGRTTAAMRTASMQVDSDSRTTTLALHTASS